MPTTPQGRSALWFLASLCALSAACGNDPPRPDFALALSPAAQTGTAGATVTYSVTTSVSAGAAQATALAVSGLPAGVTGAFGPASVTGSGASTLTLTIAASAAASTTSFTVTATAASGTKTQPASLTICVPGPITLSVTQSAPHSNASGQPRFECHDPYLATVTMNNGSCSPVTVTQAMLTGTITNNHGFNCTPAGPSVYNLTKTIGAGQTAVAFDLVGGHFCCLNSTCTLDCSESFAFQLTTSAGVLNAPAVAAEIQLTSCPDICP